MYGFLQLPNGMSIQTFAFEHEVLQKKKKHQQEDQGEEEEGDSRKEGKRCEKG
jgi:hypothetical protein